MALPSGCHEVVLSGGTDELAARVVVGARRGPRALLVGGPSARDPLGLAIAREATRAIDPSALAGAVVAVGRLDAAEGHPVLRALLDRAAFLLEVRAGAPGRPSWPHVAGDLRDEATARLLRAFGVEIVLDAAPPRGSAAKAAAQRGVPALLYEGGEEGRHDPTAVERGVWGVESLLRARRLLPGRPARPAFRLTVAKPVWLRAEAAGWLVPQVAPGDVLMTGQPVGDLHDEVGRHRGSIVSPARSVVLSMTAQTRVEAGDAVARVARVLASTIAAREPPPPLEVRRVGWCEWVALPELGIPRLHAKIDTGARTSALHVRSMRVIGEVSGRPVLELQLPVGRRPRGGKGATARVVVMEHVVVRDSGGHSERRPVIETTLVLGPLRRKVRVTLTDRGDMLFPMLVGRTAVAQEFVVDASARHLLGE
jgi:predicted deacylase